MKEGVIVTDFWWKNLKNNQVLVSNSDLKQSHKKFRTEKHGAVKYYPDGKIVRCVSPSAGIFKEAEINQGLEDQILFGDLFTVYQSTKNWVWGQSQTDGYTGYVQAEKTESSQNFIPNAFVCVPRALIYREPDFKTYPKTILALNAKLETGVRKGCFIEVKTLGWIPEIHIRSLGCFLEDYVDLAKKMIGFPYFWGGKDQLGYDCSGFVQMILEACGIFVLRNSSQQQVSIGYSIPLKPDFSNLKRGDFVFWKGHVGMMLDPKTFIHANAYHMSIAIEPFIQAKQRIQNIEGDVLQIRRL